MFRFHKAALVGGLLIAMAAPALAQTEATADTVVATVNGKDITVGHMLVLRSRLPQQYQTLPDQVLFDAILEQLVQQEVLSSTRTELSKVGRFVLDNEERALQATEAATRIADEKVTDEAVQAAYDATYTNAAPEEEFNASHILVATEEEAKAIAGELAAGGDFATLANEKSMDGSGSGGGSLGWFGKGMMVPEFEAAVLALEVGALSAPVQTQFGWHLIKLDEKRQKPVPPLEEVRDEIVSKLQQEAVQAGIAELTEAADITRVEAGAIDPAVIGNANLLQE